MKSLSLLSFLIGITVLFTASSNAQTKWILLAGNPIISSTFDAKATECYDPMVLLDGSTYKMWYTRKVAGTEKIAYATSIDGLAWTLVDTNVVIASGDITRFDAKKVGQCGIIKDGDTFKMWYWGDGPNVGTIGYAYSLDGISWTKVDGPNTDKSVYNQTADGSGLLAVVTPSVVKANGAYHMWYTQYPSWKIAYATSPDGIHWTKVTGTGAGGSVIDVGGSGSFDESIVAYPSVLATATGFEMWYVARDNVQATFMGYATSTDGIHWTKFAGSASKGSVLADAGVCSVIKEGQAYKMWYGPYLKEFNYASSIASTSVENTSNQPQVFGLYQNYPNPFNPSTVISYELPVSSPVCLKVFDLLGREVATLVNEIQSAGNHHTTFDTHNLSSGIYLYKLTAGGLSQIKKMSLVK